MPIENKKTLNYLCEVVQKFCNDRGWKNDDPNQLITSALIELGELAEHYQWQSRFKELTIEEKKELGFEFVDVLFYLFQLANKSGIDLEQAFVEKIPKLEQKFPLGQSSTEHWEVKKLYRESGKSKLYE